VNEVQIAFRHQLESILPWLPGFSNMQSRLIRLQYNVQPRPVVLALSWHTADLQPPGRAAKRKHAAHPAPAVPSSHNTHSIVGQGVHAPGCQAETRTTHAEKWNANLSGETGRGGGGG